MLKMTSLALASLLVVGGCSKKKEEGTQQKATEGAVTAPPPATPEAPKALTGKDLADRYLMCIGLVNDGKLDQFGAECLDPAYKQHDQGDGAERAADAVLAWFKNMREAMPDWKLQPQLVLVSGRNIYSMVLSTGTHTAPLKSPQGELPATNKKTGVLLFHRIAINDANKAVEEWSFADPLTIQAQLGITPKGVSARRPAIDKPVLDGAPVIVVTADDAKEKANLETARKIIAALNAGKVADLVALLQPDAIESDQTMEKDTIGTKEVEARTKMMLAAFKDAKLTVDHEIAAGDYVVQIGTFGGLHDKDLGTLKRTGKRIEAPYADVIQFKDGKESRLWHFHSDLVVAAQLGLLPPPAAPAAPAASAAATPTPTPTPTPATPPPPPSPTPAPPAPAGSAQ